jgi:arsenite oxidase small subunit
VVAVGASIDESGPQVTRRGLLAGGAAGAAVLAGSEVADAQSARYPRFRVVSLRRLRVNRPVEFDYPLRGQSSVLVDLGRSVPAGVGPRRSIVAYSVLCQHMGCPAEYRRSTREFFCPCHQSRYDAERLGAIIQGVATRGLPRIELEVRRGAVYAVGVDGLIYGYRNNLAPGRRVGGRS